MAATPLIITHTKRPGGGHFEAHVVGDPDGGQVELDYRLNGRRALFLHTGTDPALQGRGYAAQIVQAAWDWAQSEGLEVVPVCSYVAVWMKRRSLDN